MLPDVSLPNVTNPAPRRAVHLRMTTYSVGLFTRKPSQSLPAFKQKLSSLQSISQFSINTQVEESMSIPSVLGPLPSSLFFIVTPSTVRLVEYNNCTVQKPAFLNVRPFKVMFDEFCTSNVLTLFAS